MAERAGLFENDAVDFDVSAFSPKTTKSPQPPAEVVRAVSEAAKFKSREAAQAPAKPPKVSAQRRHRTGRNMQLNLKVDAPTYESFYEITDRQGWVLGETLKHALAALQRELAAQNRKA
jgi:hypothetical protein